MRRTNWERFIPTELADAEKAADPSAYFWLCGVCGEHLPYTDRPAWPIHCGRRCTVLHHVELDGHYAVSREATQAANEAKAREIEGLAYQDYRLARERLEGLIRRGPYRPKWSARRDGLKAAQEREVTVRHRHEYERQLAVAWREVEQAAVDCAQAAERADWWRRP